MVYNRSVIIRLDGIFRDIQHILGSTGPRFRLMSRI